MIIIFGKRLIGLISRRCIHHLFLLTLLTSDEEPIASKRMPGFSVVDGFVNITEDLADMINYVANEPSVGLFYVQHHTKNAVPNLVNLKNNVIQRTRETCLHTEDLEDSIAMVSSMKECGFPIVDEMTREIRKSLSIMSNKQPKRGLINSSSPGFQPGRGGSWAPVTWGHDASYSPEDVEGSSSYLSKFMRSARQRANSFKWSQVEFREPSQKFTESSQIKDEKFLSDPSCASQSTTVGVSPVVLDVVPEDLPLSSEITGDLHEESQLDKNVFHQDVLYYDEFQADKEAKLEEWLGETGSNENDRGKINLSADDDRKVMGRRNQALGETTIAERR